MSLKQSIKGTIFAGVAAAERLIGQGHRLESLAGISNFLLLQHPTALGTAVHATPLISGLRNAVPDCGIAVVASGLAIEVFRNHPGIDQLIRTPSPLGDLKAAVSSLRAQRPFGGEPFATLVTCGNERTLIGLQAVLGGAVNRIGFTEAPQLFRTPLTRDWRRSLIDNNLRLVEELGHPFRHFEPLLFITREDVVFARQLLRKSGVAKGQPVAIFVTQNSGGQRTGWHTDRFTQVIRYVAEKGCAVIFVGTVRDAAAIAAINEASGGLGISLAGQTTLTQLAAILALSDVMVSLDTGTMHMGRAAGTPMVVLGPSWQKPLEWLPLQIANARVLRGEDRATIPENYRLDEISAESVIEAVDDLLHTYPPSESARERRVEQSLAEARMVPLL